MSRRFPLRRTTALASASAVLSAVAITQLSIITAEAEEPLVPGDPLPVHALDITTSDADLGTATREVVAIVDSPEGPQVLKLRAGSTTAAERLADDLDARRSVTAEVNETLALPAQPQAAADPGKAGRQVLLRGRGEVSAKALYALGTEQYGPAQWGLAAVGAEPAWRVNRGAGTIVAVIDGGVDASHPDLAGRTLPQVDLVQDGLTGDPNGHGTHVAGIIAASLDGAGVAGLANEVQVLPVRVMDADGSGDFSTVAAGIIQSVDAGARVLNLSLGSPLYSSTVAWAVQYAVDRGVTVVAAVGNEYAEGNPIEYPAALPEVLGVSSIARSGASSWFANSGPQVDLSAPGESILSTVPGGWAEADGTSMAAPFVSAAAALVRVANPTFTRSQVDSALLGTAQDDADGDGRDNWFGYGLLQADRAALQAATAPGGIRYSPPMSPAPSASVTVKSIASRSKLRVDVNPNKGKGYWTFRVQKQLSDGTWKPLKTYRTQGSAETRTINLPKGTYRVVVNPKYGYAGTTSGEISLRK